tara:strand:- start:348 stop:599 length:252 start_codon:yes stop_codon:yes gene_type:complete
MKCRVLKDNDMFPTLDESVDILDGNSDLITRQFSEWNRTTEHNESQKPVGYPQNHKKDQDIQVITETQKDDEQSDHGNCKKNR